MEPTSSSETFSSKNYPTDVNSMLDRALMAVYNANHGLTKTPIQEAVFPSVGQIPYPNPKAIIEFLKDEGYIFEDGKRQQESYEKGVAVYYPTIKGLEFIEEARWPHRTAPFTYRAYKEHVKTVWNVVKIIVGALYALGTIYVAYKAYQASLRDDQVIPPMEVRPATK